MTWIVASIPLWMLGGACLFLAVWGWRSAVLSETETWEGRKQLAIGGAIFMGFAAILLALAAKVAS